MPLEKIITSLSTNEDETICKTPTENDFINYFQHHYKSKIGSENYGTKIRELIGNQTSCEKSSQQN